MKYQAFAVGVSISWLGIGALPAAEFPAVQKALEIPPAIAQVTDVSLQSNHFPEFILIQDIHRHPEAQANITALLLHAYHHWGVTTAYLEGAYAGQAIAREPEESLRMKLNDGTISGAEMASAMVKTGELHLQGLEDPDVYKENVKAYQGAQDEQSQALQDIKTTRMLQETLDLSQRRFSDDQLDRFELLAQLKLKPGEYAHYLADRTAMFESPALGRTMEAADRFYQLAERRSRIFIEGALRDTSPGPKAFIVGGFHTAEMAKELRAAGKSFVVLSPHVTRSGYEHLYAERMNETISALKLR